MARLFVALWPPYEILDDVAELPRPEISGLRWTTRDQWHVTLQFLGEANPVEVRKRLESGGLGAGPVRMRMGPEVTLLGREIVCIPAKGDGLEGLARRVAECTRIERTNRFRGHLTLARARKKVPKAALESLKGTSFEARWTAETLALVQSIRTPAGARYESVQTFAL